jgi:antitoxin ParD1/3/4
MNDRINARLPKPLADHVSTMVGSDGLYETPSEYIRSLIRRDMEGELTQIFNKILEGFTDIKQGRFIKSTGDWKQDKELFQLEQSKNWK